MLDTAEWHRQVGKESMLLAVGLSSHLSFKPAL